MSGLPAEWSAVCALAVLLGIKHGFDADHLATTDALTRLAAAGGRRHARWSGTLFAVGHGAVVVLVVLAVDALRGQWQVPGWLGATGAGVSLTVLLGLGIANLQAVLAAGPGQVVRPAGLRTRWLVALTRRTHPVVPVVIGALFALSFDTVSQAALFAMAAAAPGAGHALVPALLFTAGMVVVDGINGLWVARLLARADRLAVMASRVMSGGVAAASLLIAAFGLARLLSSEVDGWADHHGLAFGGLVVAILGASYLLAHLLAHPRTGASLA